MTIRAVGIDTNPDTLHIFSHLKSQKILSDMCPPRVMGFTYDFGVLLYACSDIDNATAPMSILQQRYWFCYFSLQDAATLTCTGCRWRTLSAEKTQSWLLSLGARQLQQDTGNHFSFR